MAGDEDMANSKRYGEIEEKIDDLEKAFEKCENFGILENPPFDQYFISKKINKLDGRSSLIEKIKREWEVLNLCLTRSSIFVRAYEKRPDLMRAMIVGPEGTPYHLALFCFDIRFPSNYPTHPPEVCYHFYDDCFNPNSNSNAKLNLDALSGKKGFSNLKMKSSSTPATTILQVLTNIQNSFFTKKPDGTTVREAMKQTWEAMLCMLKSPPQNFEVFVQGYFRTKAHQILLNFKLRMFLDETPMGLFFRLIRAFETNGTYCRHHYYNKDSHVEKIPHEQKSVNTSSVKKMPTLLQLMFSLV